MTFAAKMAYVWQPQQTQHRAYAMKGLLVRSVKCPLQIRVNPILVKMKANVYEWVKVSFASAKHFSPVQPVQRDWQTHAIPAHVGLLVTDVIFFRFYMLNSHDFLGQNGAECVVDSDGYKCLCQYGYIGDNCESDDICNVKNPCISGTCENSPSSQHGFRCKFGEKSERLQIEAL